MGKDPLRANLQLHLDRFQHVCPHLLVLRNRPLTHHVLPAPNESGSRLAFHLATVIWGLKQVQKKQQESMSGEKWRTHLSRMEVAG